MSKIQNRETQLIDEMKNNAISEYSNLLKSLPAKEARAAINAGITQIRNFTSYQGRNSGFTRKG